MRLSPHPALAFALALITLAHLGSLLSNTTIGGGEPSAGLLIIMDVSSSMWGEKIIKARKAIARVASELPRGSVVGLRSFSHVTSLVVPPSPDGVGSILRLVNTLRASGGTNIGLALMGAGEDIEQASCAGRPAARVPWTWILVSDGEGNGMSDIVAARKLARRFPLLRCHTIGIEVNPNGRHELGAIANELRGRSWVVGRDRLGSTMVEAASLAGFSGRSYDKGKDPVSLGLALLIIAVAYLVALFLRSRINEGAFTAIVSTGAGAAAFLANQYVLPTYGTNLTIIALLQNAAYFMVAGVIFGVALAASEGIYLNNRQRALEQAVSAFPVAVYGGALAGLLGQLIFYGIRSLAGGSLILDFGTRMTGWAAAGAIVGLCPGAAAASQERMSNGAVGGAIGGAIGGGMFEFLVKAFGASFGPRLVALVALGVSIGAMVRVVESMAKQAWLVILDGGPVGKHFILAKPKITIGTHFSNDVCVANLRGESPREHAQIHREKDGYYIVASPGGKVSVNERPVSRSKLCSTDEISIGAGRLMFHLKALAREAKAQSEEEKLPELHRRDAQGGPEAADTPAQGAGAAASASPAAEEGIYFISENDTTLVEPGPHGAPPSDRPVGDVVVEPGPHGAPPKVSGGNGNVSGGAD